MNKKSAKIDYAKKIKPGRESVILPLDLRDYLVDLAADIWKNSRTRVSKNSIFVELIKLLKSAKIDVHRIKGVEDVIAQLKNDIRKGK